jgi:hypothetical protein
VLTLLGVALVSLVATSALAEPVPVKFRPAGPGVEVVSELSDLVLSTIAVAGGVRALLVRGTTLYLARGTSGVAVMDVSDPRAPRLLFSLGGQETIDRIEGRGGHLILYPTHRSFVLVHDATDPTHPLLARRASAEELASAPSSRPAGPLSTEPRVSRRLQDLPRLDRRPESSTWDGINRFYFNALPGWNFFCFFFGGAMIDLGYEHTTASGLLVGLEVAAVASYCGSFYARGRIGYGTESFAVAASLGGGYPLYGANVGPYFRFGSFDSTYAEVWLYWMAPIPIPWEGVLRLSAPTSRDWRFLLTLGGNYYPVFGPYFLLGGQRLLSGDGSRGSGVLSFGVGLSFVVFAGGIPGPLFHIGYERRF